MSGMIGPNPPTASLTQALPHGIDHHMSTRATILLTVRTPS